MGKLGGEDDEVHVMVVARGYPTEKYKMNGIFEFDQARALARAGHKVTYAALDVRSIRRWRKWGIERKTIDGVNVYAINIPGGRIPKVILRAMSIFGLRVLYSLILKEQEKPDVMHAHFTGVAHTASKLKDEFEIPFVVTEHLSTIMKPSIDKNLHKAADEAFSSADALIAVSPHLKTVIKSRFNKEAMYIPNIVDTRLFKYAARSNDSLFRFISIGRLVVGKRMDLTIEAFAKAFADSEKVTLTIFGEGRERPRLEGLIKKYGLDKQVTLMGLQTRARIAKHLHESDCFVLASQSETFGVVFTEALSVGVPVIATRCGGPEHFIHPGNGVFVPVDDVDALARAMCYMYQNIGNYDRQVIAKEMLDQFSEKAVVNQLDQVYGSIVLQAKGSNFRA
jgi:glycosyltransferase involved in cell wall biosynthesis